jgi:nicotinamide mononucleotide adenylyltransferase
MTYNYGMILGRFQPFHLEHLRYFRLCWEQSENVIVGITNPDPSTVVEDAANDHRHLAAENPLTFTERLMMIRDTLQSEGYDMGRILIVPLPIHHPERWPSYIPDGTVLFVVAYSDWERKKAERLEAEGYKVVVVDSLRKGISAEQVRDRFRAKQNWEELVPASVVRFFRARPELKL